MTQDVPKLLLLLSNKDIAEFLDLQKLINSEALVEIAEYSVAHSTRFGDWTYIARTLSIFKNSKHFNPLIRWFCLRAGLESKQVNGEVVFTKSLTPPSQDLQLRHFLTQIPIGSQQKTKTVTSATRSKPRNTTQKKKKPKKVDLLDSWAMLPGSFGGGKRR